MFEMDDLFEAAVEITASAVEGAGPAINYASGAEAALFLCGLFDGLCERFSAQEDGESENSEDEGDAEEGDESEESGGESEEAGEEDVDCCAMSNTEGQTSMASGRFEVYRDAAGEYRFRLRARNGAVIAASEGYKSRRDCLKGIESVRRNSSSPVVEQARQE